MLIDENESKVGYGSWYLTRVISDFPQAKSVDEFMSIAFKECQKRIESIGLEEGMKIRITKVGGNKVIRTSGYFVKHEGGHIEIRQKTRSVRYNIRFVDDIEVLETVSKKQNSNVYNILDYKEKRNKWLR